MTGGVAPTTAVASSDWSRSSLGAHATWLGAVAATMLGCGRVGFEPVAQSHADAAASCDDAGHDEDGDGVSDICDVCPHLADPAQADRDQDQVGDDCDPRPDQPTERILFFDPFTSARADWAVQGQTPNYDGESLFIDGRGSRTQLDLAVAPADDRIELGLRVGRGTDNAERQIALRGLDLPGYYYCELYDPGRDPKFGITYTTGDGTYHPLQAATLPGRLQDSAAMLRMNHAASSFGCETSWPGVEARFESPTPADLVATEISVVGQGVDLWFDYFIVIRSE